MVFFAVRVQRRGRLQRSGRSLFQIAVESALDIDFQEAQQQSLSCHFLEGLGVTLVVLLGQDDDAPKIERLFNGSGGGVLNVEKRLKITRLLPRYIGIARRRKTTIESWSAHSPVLNLSSLDLLSMFSLWSKTQKSMPRQAVGGLVTLRTENRAMRHCTKPASAATNLPKITTLSSLTMHLRPRPKLAASVRMRFLTSVKNHSDVSPSMGTGEAI
jgi:hypothetical protein